MIINIRRCDRCGAENDPDAKGWIYREERDLCPSCTELYVTLIGELNSERNAEIAKFFGEVK